MQPKGTLQTSASLSWSSWPWCEQSYNTLLSTWQKPSLRFGWVTFHCCIFKQLNLRNHTLRYPQNIYKCVGLFHWCKKKSCSHCVVCSLSKGTETQIPLLTWHTHGPLEVMIIEILSLNMSEDVYLHILVMLDHFSKFVVAVLSLDQDGPPNGVEWSAKIPGDSKFKWGRVQ